MKIENIKQGDLVLLEGNTIVGVVLHVSKETVFDGADRLCTVLTTKGESGVILRSCLKRVSS